MLKEEIIQAVKSNEAISITGASCKDEYVVRSWTIEEDFEIDSDKNSVCSNKWKSNAAEAVEEALIVLDSVQKVARNMKHEN